MSKEYAIYPFRYMNITQRHDQGNHKPHWYGATNHSDKPWDEACKDTGKSYFEPQNDFIVEEVIGLDTSNTKAYTNAVRLKSVNKLYTPYKAEADYLYITLTHMNESNLKEVKKGQTLKKGTKILMEGTDGNCTGNHFHVTTNFGKYYGLLKNNNGKYCFTYEKSLLPNEAFYLDKEYTTVKNANKYSFVEKPNEIIKVGTPVERDESKDQVEVIVSELNVRNKPTTSGSKLGFANKGIYNILNTNVANGYTWYEIEENKWIASKDEVWTKLYTKTPDEVVEVPNKPNDEQKEENSVIVQEEDKIENIEDLVANIEEEKKLADLIIDLIKRIIEMIKGIFK